MGYKIIYVERDGDTVLTDQLFFDIRKDAEHAYNEKVKDKTVKDVRLMYVTPKGEDKELCRFVRHKTKTGKRL